MKKIISSLVVIILVISLLTACSSDASKKTDTNAEPITYKDGVYTAESDDFDSQGWKSTIKIVVENGKIVSVDWNGVNKDGDDKKTQSKNGAYGMVEKGGAQAEWHEQAEKVENYLIETQNPAAIKCDNEGHTDAIAGVTIHVSDFVELATKALENARK